MTKAQSARVAWPEWLAVLACCTMSSIAAIVWSWRAGSMLNYGDAVAHLHIARRVLDSHRPGITQLGSVWLPFPHLLMMPFVQVYAWWANGVAGMVPSALAYLAGCIGIYRLSRRWLSPAASALALAFFAINPNLLYLQTTAMTEPLFVCETIWGVVWLVEWRTSLETNPARAGRLQGWICAVLVAAIFTRYDGWIMTLLAWSAMGVVRMQSGTLRSRSYWICTAVLIAAPLSWLLYNAAAFGDWLYFLRGPYSAKAIEIRTATPGYPPHPGWHNPWVSLLFYTKATVMDAAAKAWGRALLALCVLGTAWGWLVARRRAFNWTLLLWFPLPFYAYSVSYGSVPIFLPPWWPHSWYNTRYGMEMLPALALGVGFAAHFVLGATREFKPGWAKYVAGVMFVVITLNTFAMVRERPLTYVEGVKNIEARRAYEEQIPPVMRALLKNRPGGTVLMITSVYPNLVAFTGIPLRQTINESDKEFYWAALAAPAEHAALVLAFEGDEVDAAVKAHPAGLTLVRRFATRGQPPGALYVSDVFSAR